MKLLTLVRGKLSPEVMRVKAVCVQIHQNGYGTIEAKLDYTLQLVATPNAYSFKNVGPITCTLNQANSLIERMEALFGAFREEVSSGEAAAQHTHPPPEPVASAPCSVTAVPGCPSSATVGPSTVSPEVPQERHSA